MNTFLRVIKEAKRYKWLLLLAIFSTIMLTAINLIAPRFMSEMTGIVAGGVDHSDWMRILHLAISLLILYLLKVLFRFLASFMSHKAAWHLVEELRLRVYTKLQNLSLDFYHKNQSGDLVSRTISDTELFEMLYAHIIPESVANAITLVGVTAILFGINAQLALMTCIPIPFIILSGWVFAKKVRPNFNVTQKTKGKLSAQLQDNFSGIKEIQLFGQQERAHKKVAKKARTATTSLLKALRLSAIFHPSVEFLTALGTVIVVGFGGYLAYQQQLQVDEIVAFMLYLSLFYAPITGIAQLLENLQHALAGAERVIEVLDAPQMVQDSEDAQPLQDAIGAISFQNVSFHYQEEKPILKDISFDVRPGEMVAIVGATGVGKSTLVHLLTRFYDPISGSVMVDGKNLKSIKLDSLRENIAMVMQDTFLFDGTIAENIAFSRPSATVEEIEAVAKAAHIHDEILSMPDGYETHVGERGAKLSGGQKQRIAIARAILCAAPILILDEATASVDVQTEANIQQAISELQGGRTIIAIAHRLSTIRQSDIILVFDEGRIVQRGNHDELIAQNGPYQTMCRIQQESAKVLE